MIHLDSYTWGGETFVRTWDTERPNVELPPIQQCPLCLEVGHDVEHCEVYPNFVQPPIFRIPEVSMPSSPPQRERIRYVEVPRVYGATLIFLCGCVVGGFLVLLYQGMN